MARFSKERQGEIPFRSAEEYQKWFVKLCGIFGDPVAGRREIRWAKEQGVRLKDPPYTHKRAFEVNPTSDQLQILEDLLQLTWGKGRLSVLDTFAGGGSIPFEAARYGFDTSATELNPVAGAILRGTLKYPFAFGTSLVTDIRHWGERLTSQLGDALSPYYPKEDAGSVHAYIWARTVNCPYTGKPVPLAPNWWLSRSGGNGKAILPSFKEDLSCAHFRVVEIRDRPEWLRSRGRHSPARQGPLALGQRPSDRGRLHQDRGAGRAHGLTALLRRRQEAPGRIRIPATDR